MDGNCLFRCISRQMYNNNTEYHLLIRNKCVDYIQYNNEFYSPFIDMDFNEYCKNRRKSGIFGDDIELTALCQLYGRNIEIYTYDINNDYKPMILKTFTPDEISKYKSPIRLEYINTNININSYSKTVHYNSLMKKSEENEYLSTTPGIYEDEILIVQKKNNNDVSEDKKSTQITENVTSTTTINPDTDNEHV